MLLPHASYQTDSEVSKDLRFLSYRRTQVARLEVYAAPQRLLTGTGRQVGGFSHDCDDLVYFVPFDDSPSPIDFALCGDDEAPTGASTGPP